MKQSTSTPPNYEDICERFPAVRERSSIVFTYGDTAYLPFGGTLSNDLVVHEETHVRQQASFPGGSEAWWTRYLTDRKFRLSQEVEAYANQYVYFLNFYNRHTRRSELKRIAADLASPIYELNISEGEAEGLIIEESEHHETLA